MRRIWHIVLVTAALGLPAGPATGQTAPADTAAVLLEAARRLEAAGNHRVAEALLALVARDYAGTPSGVTAAERLAGLRGAALAESGRVELIVWGTMYGAWLGIGVPAMLEADDPTPYGAGLLLGAPLGFAAAKAYGRSTSMSQGQARVIRWGSLWGTWQGAGWREVLNLGVRQETYCDPFLPTQCYTYQTESDVAPITASVLGGLAGTVGGALIARSRDISTGTSTLVESGSLWGVWYAGASTVLLDVDGEDAQLAWVLVGGNAGLLVGALAGPRLNWSAGRARLVSITGVAGLIAGLGLDLLFEVDDEKTAFGIPLLTSALGLGLGAQWTRDYDARRRDAGETASSAVFALEGGRLRTGVPLPAPTLLPLGYDGRRMRHEPGLTLPLVRATFSTGP